MLCACLSRLTVKLKGIRASDGTLLDHTVLLFGGAQISQLCKAVLVSRPIGSHYTSNMPGDET